MNFKILFFLLITLISQSLLACPYCAGSTEGGGKYTVVILSVFIALIYIPFYVLFKMAANQGGKSTKEESE